MCENIKFILGFVLLELNQTNIVKYVFSIPFEVGWNLTPRSGLEYYAKLRSKKRAKNFSQI